MSGYRSEELVGRGVAVLVFCPEVEDLLQIDYGPTVRQIFQCFIVLTETTTTFSVSHFLRQRRLHALLKHAQQPQST